MSKIKFYAVIVLATALAGAAYAKGGGGGGHGGGGHGGGFGVDHLARHGVLVASRGSDRTHRDNNRLRVVLLFGVALRQNSIVESESALTG